MKLQVLVGMIASGKSTYAQNAAKKGAIIVNDDAIVNCVHADLYTLYDESLKLLYKSTENHIIQFALAMGRTVIVDRGLNVSERGRKRWLSLAQSMDVTCDAVVFPRSTNEVHAERRTKSDARGLGLEYWDKVARIHSGEYVTPNRAEGFDDVWYIAWNDIQAGKVLM